MNLQHLKPQAREQTNHLISTPPHQTPISTHQSLSDRSKESNNVVNLPALDIILCSALVLTALECSRGSSLQAKHPRQILFPWSGLFPSQLLGLAQLNLFGCGEFIRLLLNIFSFLFHSPLSLSFFLSLSLSLSPHPSSSPLSVLPLPSLLLSFLLCYRFLTNPPPPPRTHSFIAQSSLQRRATNDKLSQLVVMIDLGEERDRERKRERD